MFTKQLQCVLGTVPLSSSQQQYEVKKKKKKLMAFMDGATNCGVMEVINFLWS